MKKRMKKERAIRIVQHLLAACIAFVAAVSIAGTSIVIRGLNGDSSYNLYESDNSRSYEDSYLFNNILGNNISDVLRHVAVRSQLETSGFYDDRKKIDVTAYVNRGATLTGDYVTAVYYLSDLLKWAQSGFKYETRNFTDEESKDFLNSFSTYTHLKDNRYAGGMNSYLNSQIEGNSVYFAISGNSVPAGGEHTVLLPRYQTVDGKNIEELVSSWEEYNLICSYVEESAKDLLNNYEEYAKALKYYDYLNTNLRYYITRSINGKTEVFTNVTELMGETTGIDIFELFKGYGRYVYYCPYELSYETNTQLNENVVRKIVKSYSYAYPDQVKIYIGVDTEGYGAEDAFTQGRSNFTKYMPGRNGLIVAGVIAFLAYLVLMVIYIAGIRPVTDDNEIKKIAVPGAAEAAAAPDVRIYTEAIVLIGLLIMAIPAAIFVLIGRLQGSYGTMVRASYFPYAFAVGAFVVSIGFLYMVYSLIRRVRQKKAWSESFIRALSVGFKNLVVNTTDNGNVIIRTWIPFVLFVAMNLLLFKAGIAGIIVAVCMDILVGIYVYRQNLDRDRIIHVIENIKNGDVKAKVDTEGLHGDNINLAEAVNSIGDGIHKAVDTSMKDEKLKADLITNVSHDIKTPLTSIINYVDLIKREEIDNDRVKEYIEVLDVKSQKLKQLTEDLVEASKISSGNISIQMNKINFVEMVNQTIGEFYEKLEKNNLQPIFKPDEPVMNVMADPRHLWRVIENLLNNVCKYALPGTRVYMDMHLIQKEGSEDEVVFSIKNISASELNIDASELAERFIRGDESRTTEGSGLGLSIAKNLTTAQNGTFDIALDGDLFKVMIRLKAAK